MAENEAAAAPAEAEAPPAERVLNVNVGILGHVDSGKTSLARALSKVVSTAALDRNPQSVARGITLDLGFSAFRPDEPPLSVREAGYDALQYTLVDCPGHASLIRTVLGGAQIIDIMLLVLDVTKGIQTQTAECLVVGELCTRDLVVVLNKCDMVPTEGRETALAKTEKRLRATFANTKFPDATFVRCAARPGGPESEASPEGLNAVVEALLARTKPPSKADLEAPLLFAVDHCFPIRGQGTVLTGTVLQGQLAVGQSVELPAFKLEKKVKSMQMFKKPVQVARRGDRLGVCVTQLDATLVERGVLAAPGSVPTIDGALVRVERIRFYKQRIPSKAKVHVTVGHATVMAVVHFFGRELPAGGPEGDVAGFDFGADYAHQDELFGAGSWAPNDAEIERSGVGWPREQWALLDFETPVTCPLGSLLIAAKLDTDAHTPTCRLMFSGRLTCAFDAKDKAELAKVRVYKLKGREGRVERMEKDGRTAVCTGLFKRETDLSLFTGMRVRSENGAKGEIMGSFGKTGKVKVYFPDGLAEADDTKCRVVLEFKRYMHDGAKAMVQ